MDTGTGLNRSGEGGDLWCGVLLEEEGKGGARRRKEVIAGGATLLVKWRGFRSGVLRRDRAVRVACGGGGFLQCYIMAKNGINNSVAVGIAVQSDWDNRHFSSSLTLNVRRLFEFLLQFGKILRAYSLARSFVSLCSCLASYRSFSMLQDLVKTRISFSFFYHRRVSALLQVYGYHSADLPNRSFIRPPYQVRINRENFFRFYTLVATL